jgi:hypothetical protein
LKKEKPSLSFLWKVILVRWWVLFFSSNSVIYFLPFCIFFEVEARQIISSQQRRIDQLEDQLKEVLAMNEELSQSLQKRGINLQTQLEAVIF